MSVVLHHTVDGPTEVDPTEAAVLFLVGSLGSTLDMWRPNLDGLTGRLRVVRLDLRGHGGSPVPEGDYTMAELADDVIATADALGVDRFHYCGVSLGGMIGMYLGSEYPDRVRSLTLCCTTSYFEDKQPWLERKAAVTREGTGSIAPTVVSRWYTEEFAAAHPEVVAESVGWITGTSDVGYAGCLAAVAAWDHRERLGAVTAPTLVIGGAEDRSIPVEPHLRTVAEGIPGARLEVLAAAHVATVERAAESTQLLLDHVHP